MDIELMHLENGIWGMEIPRIYLNHVDLTRFMVFMDVELIILPMRLS